MNDKDKSLKEEFCSACAELAERATKEVLAQLSAEQLQEIGRAVVHQWVCGNITKEAGKMADSVAAILMGEADCRNAKALLGEAGIEQLVLRLNMKAVAEAVLKVNAEREERKAREAAVQEDAAGQMFPDAGMPADTQEAEEDLPTAPCEPLFSAEDMSEGAAEGEQNAETEGGAE